MENNIILQVGVKVLLKKEDGKYLLVRRSLKKYPEVKDTRWDIVGGRINPGSTLMDNLKREVKEETGLDLFGEPNLISAQDILRIPGRHIVRLTYIGECSGEVTLDEMENDDFKWVSFDELLKMENLDEYFKGLLDSKKLF